MNNIEVTHIIIKVVCGFVCSMLTLSVFSWFHSLVDSRLTSTYSNAWDLEDREHPGGRMW